VAVEIQSSLHLAEFSSVEGSLINAKTLNIKKVEIHYTFVAAALPTCPQ
jgi:predicted acyltransferase (DUF342 family)